MNWIQLVSQIAVMVLASNPKTATLAPHVVKGIVIAEGIKGATGKEKLGRSIQIAQEGFLGWNAVQPGSVNTEVSSELLSDLHSAIVDSANVLQKAKLLKAN